MTAFYLTPAAVGNLSLLIFVAFVIGYLLILLRRARRRGEKPVEIALLLGGFGGTAVFIILLFLEYNIPLKWWIPGNCVHYQ